MTINSSVKFKKQNGTILRGKLRTLSVESERRKNGKLSVEGVVRVVLTGSVAAGNNEKVRPIKFQH